MKSLIYTAALLLLFSCTETSTSKSDETSVSELSNAPHIVFLTGDEEYRGEESMPMLARITKRELGAKVSMVYAVDSNGIIAPNRTDHLIGLEALKDADLVVFFLRFRELPPEQAQLITDYAESGRPMVGFRTSTHSFKYLTDSSMMHLNDEWPTKVFGQQWITHHGHFEDGHNPLTHVSLVEGKEHPILNGLNGFDAYSWLYHVDGGDWKLSGDSDPILLGESLRSKHAEAGRLDQYSITNPVAWTKTYTGTSEKPARVFFTTLGHPFDFKLSPMRTLAMNGIYWALGKESEIPADGVNSEIVGVYKPNNSGFGEKYKLGVKPEVIE